MMRATWLTVIVRYRLISKMLKRGGNMYFKSQRNMIKLVASGKGTGRMENEWEEDFALYNHLHLLNFESCKFITFHII